MSRYTDTKRMFRAMAIQVVIKYLNDIRLEVLKLKAVMDVLKESLDAAEQVVKERGYKSL